MKANVISESLLAHTEESCAPANSGAEFDEKVESFHVH